MKNLATIITLILLSMQAAAETTIRLRVAATVPPRPCEVGQSCEAANATVAPEQTQVVVAENRILYVGSKPVVTEQDGLTTVLF